MAGSRDEARVFLHEFDHLDGILLPDLAETGTFMRIENARDPNRRCEAERVVGKRRRPIPVRQQNR